MNLPVYELQIDTAAHSELMVSAIALVDKPAVEKNFLAFKAQQQSFATVDEDRRIISGLLMAADQLIYRKDEQFGEYNVVFRPSTIYNIAQKFFALGYNNSFNIMHLPNMKCEGVTIFESFITDPERGIQSMKGFEDVKAGSWFGSAYVQNDDVWKAIKDGLVKGFSVEGLFTYSQAPITVDEELLTADEHSEYQQILDVLKK
jgi:hypothetical protein